MSADRCIEVTTFGSSFLLLILLNAPICIFSKKLLPLRTLYNYIFLYSMAINIKLAALMAKKRISLTELAEKIGITQANLSILKTGKGRAIRFSTLEAICDALDCGVEDIIEYKKDN